MLSCSEIARLQTKFLQSRFEGHWCRSILCWLSTAFKDQIVCSRHSYPRISGSNISRDGNRFQFYHFARKAMISKFHIVLFRMNLKGVIMFIFNTSNPPFTKKSIKFIIRWELELAIKVDKSAKISKANKKKTAFSFTICRIKQQIIQTLKNRRKKLFTM